MKKNKGWVSEEQQIQRLYEDEANLTESISAMLEGRPASLPYPTPQAREPNRKPWLGANQVCLKCRTVANNLPCAVEHHEYIIYGPNLRAPARNRRKAWKKFLQYLQRRGLVRTEAGGARAEIK